MSKFFPYAHKRLGFNKPVQLNLVSDPQNAKDPFGKTAYYDPGNMHITIFVDKRENNLLKKIIIKEKISSNQSKIILAQSGVIINDDEKADRIILKNGKIINTEDENQNVIDFSSFNLNLSKFNWLER